MERVRHHESRRRTGSTVVELIVAFPIMVIALFALAEFGLLLTNQQRLEAASRLGALLASEAGTLPQTNAEFTASPMISAIERHLQQANWDTSAANLRVTLEHNVGGGFDQVVAGTLDCPPPNEPPAPDAREYVRLTICADIVNARMTPNLLSYFGFDLEGWTTHQTTTLRYEQGPTP